MDMKRRLDVAEIYRNLPDGESLLALLAFESEGDLVRAAKSLGLSQPALSFQLKKLERSLQFSIFSVAGKRKVLTKLGQAYVNEIKEIYQSLNLLHERIAHEARDLNHQKIRVAGRRELFIPFLEFPFPGQIEFIQSTSSDAIKALREHRVDLAIAARTLDSGDLVARVFFESSFKLIYPKSWKVDRGAFDALKSQPVVAYGNHHAYLEDYLKWKGWRSQELKVSRIVEDWFSVVELVRRGFGWAIIPEAWGLHTKEVAVEALLSNPVPKQKIFLFHRRDDRNLPWVKGLSEWLVKP
jgi:DNA-binding transcriptional LysR family regulator